ncbi:MAG TPA: hypothetical protein VEK32_18225 [Thermodesulfobacteriota bacterium]|nr:hypothetical protein [Thermodesulfobacteriota bacterium]
MMTKTAIFSLLSVLIAFPSASWPQKADPTVLDFKVQALYRAAKLTWKVKDGFKSGMAIRILRAETFEEGPYKEVDMVSLTSGKNVYEYVDKSMGTEAKYYYKLIIEETDESFGPIPTRPYFSPPATHLKPPVPKPESDHILSFHFSARERQET